MSRGTRTSYRGDTQQGGQAKLQAMGHTVKSMAPQFAKPYVKTNKNDAADGYRR